MTTMLLMAFLGLNVMILFSLGLSILELYGKVVFQKYPQLKNAIEVFFQTLAILTFLFLGSSLNLFLVEIVSFPWKLTGEQEQNFPVVVIATTALLIVFIQFVLTGQPIAFLLVVANCYYSGMTGALKPILQKALAKKFELTYI